ncbi:uncharacterized protein YwbO-like [Babylonia areolata]|uniref:uncharacterized protein YwbO-like n=1 Tax=Babylonia areolata TaxID=304850 RepID=UPI003FD539D5
MADKPMVDINIVSDVTCPFCWIGKKKLEASMKKLENKMEFRVQWSPFQLRPEAPPEGMDVPPQYKEPRLLERIRKSGDEVGIQLNFSYACLPNTTMAHALLDFVGTKDDGSKQSDVAEMLFKTHFTDGIMLSEETLVKIGTEAGYDTGEVRAYITDPENLENIRQASQENRSKMTGGVPTYYFNGQHMFSGAQSEDVYIKMLTVAAERFPVAVKSKA